MTLQLKRAKGIMHSQQGMASIALSVIGCIDYLAYGTIFMRAMFLLKKKLDVFFPARKARDEPRRVVELLREGRKPGVFMHPRVFPEYLNLGHVSHECRLY